jgi:hypothetical protein
LDAVAERAHVDPDSTSAILAEHGIREYLPAAPAARLRIQHIRFSGLKNLQTDPPSESFEFALKIPDGVSALARAGNSAGKTSVIEIIRWLLTGGSAVDKWVFKRVREAALTFTVDGQQFNVEVEYDGADLTGHLLGRGEVLRTFDQRSFEGVMEELLLPRLGLDRISVFQRAKGSTRGKITEAGWPFLSDCLHVRPSELSTVVGGVAQRAGQILQVYLALPWYDTLLQARAAASASRQETKDIEQAAKAQEDIRGQETDRIIDHLTDARDKLASMDDEKQMTSRLRNALDRAAALAEADLLAGARLQAATTELATAEDMHVAAQRTLRNIIEREAAGAFFRALEPKACPRCAAPIDEERRAHEAAEHVCSVCDREARYEPDATARVRAQEQITSTTEAVSSAKQALEDAEAEREEIGGQRAAVEQEISQLVDSRALNRRREQEALVYRLEGRIQEREAARQRLQDLTAGPDDTPRVLNAAEAEADRRVRQSTELFDELNEEILTLGQRFGISGLTRAKLDRGAHLPVTKEGTDYNFGELPPGDKLRLKVAVVISLLRVGHRHGAGRHPGLLFVDSPGAEEVAPGSLHEMISGLVEVADELDLQVVAATARLDDVQTVLKADRLRIPDEGRTTLW